MGRRLSLIHIYAEDYQELLTRRMGISSFYEFNVKNGNSGNFRAVPDGSTDLVFGIEMCIRDRQMDVHVVETNKDK